MTKQLWIAARMLLVLTVLFGVVYPLVITVAAQVVFPSQANGSLITDGDTVIGSALIGQSFNEDPRYFWSRPSAVGYNPLPSGASNLSVISTALRDAVRAHESAFRTANAVPDGVSVPHEMLFASGSGLDPHISPEAARLQVGRVAQARALAPETVAALVEQFVESPQLGFLGQARVNVLLLNVALDGVQ